MRWLPPLHLPVGWELGLGILWSCPGQHGEVRRLRSELVPLKCCQFIYRKFNFKMSGLRFYSPILPRGRSSCIKPDPALHKPLTRSRTSVPRAASSCSENTPRIFDPRVHARWAVLFRAACSLGREKLQPGLSCRRPGVPPRRCGVCLGHKLPDG